MSAPSGVLGAGSVHCARLARVVAATCRDVYWRRRGWTQPAIAAVSAPSASSIPARGGAPPTRAGTDSTDAAPALILSTLASPAIHRTRGDKLASSLGVRTHNGIN